MWSNLSLSVLSLFVPPSFLSLGADVLGKIDLPSTASLGNWCLDVVEPALLPWRWCMSTCKCMNMYICFFIQTPFHEPDLQSGELPSSSSNKGLLSNCACMRVLVVHPSVKLVSLRQGCFHDPRAVTSLPYAGQRKPRSPAAGLLWPYIFSCIQNIVMIYVLSFRHQASAKDAISSACWHVSMSSLLQGPRKRKVDDDDDDDLKSRGSFGYHMSANHTCLVAWSVELLATVKTFTSLYQHVPSTMLEIGELALQCLQARALQGLKVEAPCIAMMQLWTLWKASFSAFMSHEGQALPDFMSHEDQAIAGLSMPIKTKRLHDCQCIFWSAFMCHEGHSDGTPDQEFWLSTSRGFMVLVLRLSCFYVGRPPEILKGLWRLNPLPSSYYTCLLLFHLLS